MCVLLYQNDSPKNHKGPDVLHQKASGPMAAYGLLSEGTMEGASSCLMLFASPFTKFGGVVDSWLNSCA